MAQLKGYIDSTDKTFKSINEICNFFKQTIVYQNYQTIIEWIVEIANVKDVGDQNKILNYVKYNTKYKFNTFAQFINWIKITAYDIQRKFNANIPKLAYNKLKIIRYMWFTPNNQL